MKKAIILLFLLPLLTGCWDRLPLRKLNLVDTASFDLNKESGETEIFFVVTKLKSAGQGTGEPNSKITKLKGPSLVEAIGQGQFSDQAPFLGITTGAYLLSENFVSHDPVSALEFLLHTPYSSINIPVVVFEGDMPKFLETATSKNKEFTDDFYDFNKALEVNSIVPNITMVNFIQSRKEPLEDLALPVMKQADSGMELSGVLLFRNGTNTGTKLTTEQIQMITLMLGKYKGRQKYTGSLSDKSTDPKSSKKSNEKSYSFSVKKADSKITISSDSNNLPKVKIKVRLKINVFKLDKEFHKYKPEYVNQMEKELSNKLEEMASSTIKTIQTANCDLLGIGMELKAKHPKQWKAMDWRKDYPGMSIEPNFDVQIINADSK